MKEEEEQPQANRQTANRQTGQRPVSSPNSCLQPHPHSPSRPPLASGCRLVNLELPRLGRRDLSRAAPTRPTPPACRTRFQQNQGFLHELRSTCRVHIPTLYSTCASTYSVQLTGYVLYICGAFPAPEQQNPTTNAPPQSGVDTPRRL